MKRSDRFIVIIRNLFIGSNKYFIIIFYDILLLDDIIYIRKFHDRRRRLFKSLIQRIPDRTDIENRKIIDFSSLDVLELLNKTFSKAITQRWEGFVLKIYNKLYFSYTERSHSSN
jgi:DNA ligase-4